MSETTRPEISEVNAARGIAMINHRLGERTAEWITNLASNRLPSDPADQEHWTPLVRGR